PDDVAGAARVFAAVVLADPAHVPALDPGAVFGPHREQASLGVRADAGPRVLPHIYVKDGATDDAERSGAGGGLGVDRENEFAVVARRHHRRRARHVGVAGELAGGRIDSDVVVAHADGGLEVLDIARLSDRPPGDRRLLLVFERPVG